MLKSKRGFTLIEFIIYFGILSLVITAVVGFMLVFVQSRTKTIAVSEVEANARFVLNRVLWSTRQAVSVNSTLSATSTDNGVLALNTVTPATSPTVFNLNSGTVFIKEGSSAQAPLTTPEVTVTKLRFTQDSLSAGVETVTAAIALQYHTTNKDFTFNYATSATTTAVIRQQAP
jgi:type II secretory pathway pseudopilin PulG